MELLFSFVFVFPLLGSIACDTLCETPQGRGRPKKGGAGPVWGHGDGSTEVCDKIIIAKQCKKIYNRLSTEVCDKSIIAKQCEKYKIAFQYQTMSEGPSKGRPVGQVDKLKCGIRKVIATAKINITVKH